jgi:ubiquinone/menaquinone biosynthesis C-methylase UbiE
MTAMAAAAENDPRLCFDTGVAERLPYPDAQFDLAVSTTSFDHWADQQAGLREAARVLARGGHLVLVDLFSPLLAPTLINDRRSKARTRHRADRLLQEAGFTAPIWHKLYTPIINAVVAVAG